MKLRSVMTLLLALAAVAPMSARAEHCDVPIYIFSRTRQTTAVENPTDPGTTINPGTPWPNSAAGGCLAVRDTVLAGEDPTTHPATETDLIYPGANNMYVRWLQSNDPATIVSATVTFAGQSYDLVFEQTVDVTGAPADFLDSQLIDIDPANTLSGNAATATVCTIDEECFTRTYKTIA